LEKQQQKPKFPGSYLLKQQHKPRGRTSGQKPLGPLKKPELLIKPTTKASDFI
jgi:hypothetical protein